MIHVVFNIDKNYSEHCKNVMRSILANTKSEVKFHIIGLDVEGCECYKIPNTSNLKVIRNPNNQITESAVYRLYIPDLIKADKCIYLDSDLIVLDDIQKLWDTDIEYIGGVLDPMAIYQAGKNNLHHGYINSGVMVLNLKNLRKIDYWERIYKAQKTAKNLSLVDQDTINIAFGDLIEHLPEEWNVYSKIYSQTTQKMLKARENPSIIHWCGFQKPWNADVWKKHKWREYMKAIVLTHAPINEADAKLLRETNIFKIACNNYCADLKPNLRLCADDIVDKCLECDTCDVVSCNFDLHKDRVINGAYLPKRYSTLLSCIDYLYLKGYDKILLVASNPESATHKINYDGVNEIKKYLYLYKYTKEGCFDIPHKTIKEFIMLTDDEKILGIEENRERKMLSDLLFTDAYLFEVQTVGKNNKSVETGYVIGNILPFEQKQRFLQGDIELEYNNLIVRRIMPEVKEAKIEEKIEEKPIVKKAVAKKKPTRKVSKK